MTDNTKMVDLPWHDGTTRTVLEWTIYEAANGLLLVARAGGYSHVTASKSSGLRVYRHSGASVAVRIFTEAPEPPVKVDVPTGIAAVVSAPMFPDRPGYVLTRDGWRGLRTHRAFDPSEIADQLRDGARVIFEGVDESLDE